MKIISWNCNGAFRKKCHLLDKYDADLLIIQECENPGESTKSYQKWVGENYLWIGKNKNRGIGVFSRKNTPIEVLAWPDDNLELFLPFQFDSLSIIAVWTKEANSPTFKYIGQVWKYLQLNNALLVKHQPCLIGDFNSNAIWDIWDRWWNHTDVVRELENINIHSLYHKQVSEHQGEETINTFYMHRNVEKPYHIDYAFLPKLLLKDTKLEIGKKEEWLESSDHLPLIIQMQ